VFFLDVDLEKLDMMYARIKEVYNWTEQKGLFRPIVAHGCSNTLMFAGKYYFRENIFLND